MIDAAADFREKRKKECNRRECAMGDELIQWVREGGQAKVQPAAGRVREQLELELFHALFRAGRLERL